MKNKSSVGATQNDKIIIFFTETSREEDVSHKIPKRPLQETFRRNNRKPFIIQPIHRTYPTFVLQNLITQWVF